MDHKTWLWGKKSKEKTIPTTDKVYVPMNDNEEVEIRTLLSDKVELENEFKLLKDKLSSVISECDAKDEVVEEKTMMAQEAAAGCEKAEAEAALLRKQLDEAQKWRMASEERTVHLNAALKECMEQLHFVREEQENRIHDAITKTSKEYKKLQMAVEEKLEETRKKLAKVFTENASLREAVSMKEKVIEDLNKQRVQLEADLNALIIRLEMTEKENTSLKYEVRVIGKEIEIRNEEREFNRRTAEASQKQHLESVKKIAKLESECQRLRLLVRKRLPGPAALSKMRNEVEMLGRESVEFRRRKSTPALTAGLTVNPAIDAYADAASRNVNLLLEQLYSMEEENKALKEALNKKTNELQLSRVMHARSTSKLSEMESQLEESPKGDPNMEQMRNGVMSHVSSLMYTSDVGSDDKASCAESWASALISELDHFKNEKLRESPSSKTVGSSDMSLMDDFLEMEKLALTTVDKPLQDQPSLKEANLTVGPSQSVSTEVTGMEMVPVAKSLSEFGLTDKIESTNVLIRGYPDWLQKILQLIFTQAHATQKQTSEVLQDVRKVVDDMESGDYLCRLDPSHVTDSISRNPSNASSLMDASGLMADGSMAPAEMSDQKLQPELSKSICRIIELIEGIQLQSSNSIQQTSKGGCVSSGKQMEESSGYMTLVFQWKTAELSVTLQVLIHACYDLMNGMIDFAKFTEELAFTLDWIMKNRFSFQDVSSMRHESKKHSHQDDPNGSEAEVIGHLTESAIPASAAPFGCNNLSQKNEGQLNSDEHKEPVDELTNTEAANSDLTCNDSPSTKMNGNLMNQLPEPASTTGKLQLEPKPLEKTVEVIQESFEPNVSLGKLSFPEPQPVAEIESVVSLQMMLSLPAPEPEPENNSGSGEFKKTCEDSEVKGEARYPETKQEEIQFHTEWEITVASEKLAECQEAILNLGKQFKALASPTEASLFDKVISAPGDSVNILAITSEQLKGKMTYQRSSLIEQMIAEDSFEAKQIVPSQTKAVDSNSRPTAAGVAKSKGNDASVIGAIEHLEKILLSSESTRYKDDDGTTKSMAVVPSKKQGVGSLWKKLLWRKRKSISKSKPPSFKQNTK